MVRSPIQSPYSEKKKLKTRVLNKPRNILSIFENIIQLVLNKPRNILSIFKNMIQLIFINMVIKPGFKIV
jgi:hypothetical protein